MDIFKEVVRKADVRVFQTPHWAENHRGTDALLQEWNVSLSACILFKLGRSVFPGTRAFGYLIESFCRNDVALRECAIARTTLLKLSITLLSKR